MREMSLLEQLEIAEEVLETDEEYESKRQAVLNKIKGIKARKRNLNEELSLKNQKWSVGDIIWTIFVTPIVVLGVFFPIVLPFAGAGYVLYEALERGKDMKSVIAMPILLCVIGFAVIGFMLWLLRRKIREHKKEKEHKLNLQREYQELCDKMPQMIAELEKEIESINMERQKYLEETRHHLLFLPRTYRKHVVVAFMLECVSDCRADTLKEAINLWENELRYNAALRAAQQQAEEEQYYYEAILRETQRQADELERIRQNSDYERWNNNNN